ncbi:MAG TPA: bestrophin family ion channel [Flavisolibacter sp.]|jgi:putative membrane protein|nr:bestrophin family ion channel [Flavisolibacter sp.]
MHAGTHYKVSEFLYWTRREIYVLMLLAAVPTLLYQTFDLHWLAIPWVPIALIGTATAFIIGFKNTQTYNRLWEARQIWGAIVNASRAWGIMVKDFVQADIDVHQQLIYRHCAWLTALRHQLRKPQTWENSTKLHNVEYRRLYTVPEWATTLEEELKNYLPAEELQYILAKKNRATQLISLQSKQLTALKRAGCINPLEYVEMEKRLADLYDQQGKCERIKNFPYPRQFASITLFFVWLFVGMLPFGMLNEFQKLGEHFTWLTIPFSVIVSWVFVAMDKVSEATENPFEGGANDIPMAALSRAIEIDLRDMLDEQAIPAPLTPVNNILL